MRSPGSGSTEIVRALLQIVLTKDGAHRIEILDTHLDDGAEFLRAQRSEWRRALQRNGNVEAAVAGEGHLQKRDESTAIGAVVIGEQQIARLQRRNRADKPGEQLRIVQIGRHCAECAIYLCEA